MFHLAKTTRAVAARSGRLASRYSSTSTGIVVEDAASASEESISQREVRERAMAEALARDEEAYARAKRLRELKDQTRDLISTLNKTPSTLINARLAGLQEQLDALPDQKKVQQLNEELEQFFEKHMKLPASETTNKPWANGNKSITSSSDGDSTTLNIKSTASSSFSNQFPNLKPSPDYKPYSEQELFLRQLAHTRQSGNLGSTLTDIHLPKNETRKPKSIDETSIATLMAAGCHLGHAKAQWRPTTQPFIYGEYQGVHLIDLNETLAALKRASRVIQGISAKGGVILYVGTSKSDEQHLALEAAAKRSQSYYISKRWIPGIVTNFFEVTKQIGGSNRVEVDMSNKPTGREIGLQEQSLIKPDLVVILNPVENRNCINECIKSRVPTIGLCDTNMEPSLLTYPIPCNDDNVRATSLMVGVLSKAAEAGLQQRLDRAAAYQQAQKSMNAQREPRQPVA